MFLRLRLTFCPSFLDVGSMDDTLLNRTSSTRVSESFVSTQCLVLSSLVLSHSIVLLGMRHFRVSEPAPALAPDLVSAAHLSLAASGDYELAERQSLGFFQNVASSTWKRLQKKARAMSPNFCANQIHAKFAHFYQCHYEPDFVCGILFLSLAYLGVKESTDMTPAPTGKLGSNGGTLQKTTDRRVERTVYLREIFLGLKNHKG